MDSFFLRLEAQPRLEDFPFWCETAGARGCDGLIHDDCGSGSLEEAFRCWRMMCDGRGRRFASNIPFDDILSHAMKPAKASVPALARLRDKMLTW